jgi:hypothetical protein
MKKQILFLTMFTLALIFAGTNKVVGQLLPGVTGTTPIIPLACIATSEPLHPFPGVPYKYSLDGTAGTELADDFTWWATKDMAFMTAPGTTNIGTALAAPNVLNTSTTYGATTPAATAGANEVTITWGAELLAGTDYQGLPGPGTPTFVVGYSKGVKCADNIQVYEINPMPNFTIDITAIDPADNATKLGWDVNTGELCVDVIQSASYNPATFELTTDFGTNTFYYEVAAANFVKNWTPTFTLMQSALNEGLRTTQTAVLEMFPTLADAIAGTNSLGSNSAAAWTAAGGTWATGVALNAATPADAATGVSVYVKVVIDNNTEESLTNNPFVLAVDAIDNDAAGIWDMEDEDCTALVDAADQVDRATITVTPRPQLDHNTIDGGTPNPTNVVPKVDMPAATYPRF